MDHPISPAPPDARRYHAEFVRHAKAHLEADVFDRLHKKARGSAGGMAPRRSMDAQGDDDVASVVDKAQPGPSDVHVDVPMPLSGKRAKKSPKGAKKKKGEQLVLEAPAKAVVKKDAEPLRLHIACGAAREPGFVGLDVYAHDDATIVHDPEVGLPFEDGTVHEVFVSKDYLTKSDDVLDEVQRVLAPNGRLLTDAPLAADSAEDIRKNAHVHTPGARAGDGAAALTSMTAERRELICKSLDRELPIAAVNSKRQIIYAPALVPDEVHCSLDWMTPEDIEYTAHQYLAKARVIGAEHRGPIDAEVVESFICPTEIQFDGTPYGAQSIPKGSWVLGIKVNDRAEWAKVEAGEYTGLSVGGFGLREALTQD